MLTPFLAFALAWWLPFDQLIARIAPWPLSHAIAVLFLAMLGRAYARQTGLRMAGPWRPGVVAGVAMAAYVLLLDLVLLRGFVAAPVRDFAHTPLAPRLAYFMARAFNENVIYRLCLFGGFLAAWQRMRAQKAGWGAVLALATLAQVINIGVNVLPLLPEAPTAASLAYDCVRYVVPGVVWALLFWRHGFVAAEVASVGCHLIIQPAMGIWG